MSLNGFILGERKPVMHQPIARPQSPERCRSHLCRGTGVFGSRRGGDAVTGFDVVQEEVAVGVDYLASQGGGNDEGAAVDRRPREAR